MKGDLEKMDVQVLVVDPHERYRIAHMLRSSGEADGGSAFPILADPAQTISATYGVASQMRIHGEWSNRPSTFLIDKEGIIRYRHLATTYADRPELKKILDILRRLAGLPPEPSIDAGARDERAAGKVPAAEGTLGKEAFLKEVAGSKAGYSLVSIFHPSCAGCLTEAKALSASDKIWKELGVTVLGLAVTAQEEPVARFSKLARATYRIERSPWAGAGFQVDLYPALIVVNRKGEVVFRASEDDQNPVESARRFLENASRSQESGTPPTKQEQ